MNPTRPGTAGHQARILIVDDEYQNRQLLEVMLAPESYLLQTAANGEEALDCVTRQPPDLVLLDIMMPGMDGYQVAAAIKGNLVTKNIPVIMVTALHDRSARMLGLTAGAEDFLSKPVDRAELCVRVRNLLRLKAYADYSDQYSQTLELLTERFSLATAVARVGVWEWDLAGNMLTWDATMFEIYGFAPAIPMPYEQWAAAVHHEDLPAVEASFQKTMKEKGQATTDYRIILPDGSVRSIAAVERAVLDERSNVIRLIGVNMDVTERKEAEKALEQSRRDQISKNVGKLQSMIDELLKVTRQEPPGLLPTLKPLDHIF